MLQHHSPKIFNFQLVFKSISMNKNLIMFVFLGQITSCANLLIVPLDHYSIQVSCYKNSIEFYPDNSIKRCRLSEQTTINSYQCISWLHLFDDGGIKQYETAVDIPMTGYTIPAKSTIFFNEEAKDQIKFLYLAKDTEINGVLCEGSGTTTTEFYDSDHLKYCFLANDQTIQGFPCNRNLMQPVYFYYSGKIKILTLSTDYSWGNTVFKKGTSVLVGEDGSVSVYKR